MLVLNNGLDIDKKMLHSFTTATYADESPSKQENSALYLSR